MKKTSPSALDMLPEYDFAGAVRGHYAGHFAQGYTVRVEKTDGSTEETLFTHLTDKGHSMADISPVNVSDLKLDLTNFRNVPQADESHALQSMIAIHADYFWALMESLISDGYLPTENILVLRTSEDPSSLVVKEGNRRVGALKVIHGYLSMNGMSVPGSVTSKISAVSSEWKQANKQVPCTIYKNGDAAIVDRIVALTHGKAQKAGRDTWNAVARARHNRDVNKANEPALDLLEKYLKLGRNLTPDQKERWAGAYPLTVLEDTVKRTSTRFGVVNSRELANNYPSIQHLDSLDDILRDIGLEIIRFATIRDTKEDFAEKYSVPVAPISTSSSSNNTQGNNNNGNQGSGAPTSQPLAFATNDPEAVKNTLKNFVPRGNNREKVALLRNEAIKIKLKETPTAFCFLLRSMFEISVKAYCNDHQTSGGPSYTYPSGKEKSLKEVLDEIYTHMVTLPNGKVDKAKQKLLHGASTELGKSESVLSVTSMNQLVHNPTFSITAGDISTLFGNVFPLLQAMNQ